MVALLSALLLFFDLVPPPPASWTRAAFVDGIVASTAPSNLGAPWGSAEGFIDAPVDAVLAHLLDFPAMVHRIPKLTVARVLERQGDQALVYFYFDLPWPVSNRDYTVRFRWHREEGGGARIDIEDANAAGPKPSDAVRMGPVQGYWELLPGKSGGTVARHVFLAVLGGSLPRSVVTQTAWKQPLESIKGIRKALARHR